MATKQTLLSGWGNYPRLACDVVTALDRRSVDMALQAPKLIARGMGRSYADQALNPDKLVVDISRCRHFLSWDESSGLLECEAGTSLRDIIEVFAPRGWFPRITPGTKFVTVGGCIANDIHGKSHHVDGSFNQCVEEITVLLANGETVTASRDNNADFFFANFGGLGLLGIILSAKIRLRRIETTYFSQVAVRVPDLEALLDSFEEYDHIYDYQVAWVDSLASGSSLGRGVASFARAATLEELSPRLAAKALRVSPDPVLDLPFHLPDFALNSFSIKLLNKVLDEMQSRGSGLVHYESLLFPLDAISNWNRGYGKRGFIQYQFVIPLENGRANVRRLMEEIANSGMSPFLNVLKKFGKGIGGLSFPMEGYTFAIDFPYHERIHDFARRLDKMVLECGGRVYLGKDALLDEAMFKQMYPQYRHWMELKNQYDPEHKFSSALGRRIGLSR